MMTTSSVSSLMSSFLKWLSPSEINHEGRPKMLAHTMMALAASTALAVLVGKNITNRDSRSTSISTYM